MFLPWELYELAVHPSWGRLALLAINLPGAGIPALAAAS